MVFIKKECTVRRFYEASKFHNSTGQKFVDQAPVVQTLDSAIHRINHYPADSVIDFPNTYPLDSDLSGG